MSNIAASITERYPRGRSFAAALALEGVRTLSLDGPRGGIALLAKVLVLRAIVRWGSADFAALRCFGPAAAGCDAA